LKEIKDFFGNQVKIATLEDLQTIGFDPRYVGWTLSTTFNSGDARVTGMEFNVRHSLRALGRFGNPFTVFANYTHLKLEGHQQASFRSFIPKSGNWGFSFSAKRFSTTLRWNYRGLQQRAPVAAFGPDGFEYFKARVSMDMNLSYQLTRRLSIVGSATNVFNQRQVLLRYGSATPDYAREYQQAEFGVLLAVGIKGTF
jgi:iron complex outermembrane recepter protein